MPRWAVRSRLTSTASAALLVVAVVSGCGTGAGGTSVRSAGAASADAGDTFERKTTASTPDELADVMAWELSDRLEAVRDHHDAGAMVAEVVGADSPSVPWSEDLELLVARGSTGGQGGALVEVRLLPDGGAGGGSDAGRCYRYVVMPWGVDDHAPHRTGCDGRPALSVPERISPAAIADGAEEAVDRALSAGPDGGVPDVTSVQEALASLVDERGSITVTGLDGAIGVGVFVPGPDRDCLLGRRTAAGEVHVWFPDDVLVAPGEASCDADTAVVGGAARSPH